MKRVLVLHGLGMNMRGKVKQSVFGKATLPEYDAAIRSHSTELGISVDIFQSNIEGELVNKLYAGEEEGIDGAIINPAGFTIGYRGLTVAIDQVGFPVVEVHVSNPLTRGLISEVGKFAAAQVTGFGLDGYRVALIGLSALIDAKSARSA
ncbi:MAG TPA: type II 3-dehydroquinate dehydratase [Dongiaceae bacterium]